MTKLKFHLLCLLLFTIHISSGQICSFENIKKIEWEPNIYSCKLSSILADSQEYHLPDKSNDDVLIVNSYKNTIFKNLDIKFSRKFKNIEMVELRHAGIESISENLFENCNKLKFADFSGNKIQEIPQNLFSHSSKLMEIALGGNKLMTLSEKLFENLTKLETLTLHDNKITLLPPKTFSTLENLRELYLGNNKIQILDSNLFKNLKNLETLDLNNNEISDLPENIFTHLINLRTLNLRKNLLTVIHLNSFGNLDNLEDVDLSFNNISSIDEKVIDDTGVMVLMMENNFCSNDNVQSKEEMKKLLKQCFDSYEFRNASLLETVEPSTTESPHPGNNIIECGKPVNITLVSRIVVGTQVGHGNYPWLALLVTSNGEYRCGGSLISKTKVVTAAHCVTSFSTHTILSPDTRRVLLGVYDFSDQNEAYRQNHSISKILVHPEFKFLVNSSHDADVAVLELTDEVKFTKFIRPICLMEPFTFPETIKNGIAVGYGKSENLSVEHENIARFIGVPIYGNEHCLLSHEAFRQMSSNRTFCGGYANGTGVCKGDSGNGLIVLHNDTYYLRGIVSGSVWDSKYECDVNNYAIFTDVPKFYNWITTGNLDPEPSTDQKIKKLVHQIMALAKNKSQLELLKKAVDERLQILTQTIEKS